MVRKEGGPDLGRHIWRLLCQCGMCAKENDLEHGKSTRWTPPSGSLPSSGWSRDLLTRLGHGEGDDGEGEALRVYSPGKPAI